MWEKIVTNLSKQLSRPQYESWIKPIKFLRVDERNIYLAVSSIYSKTWIKKNLSAQIVNAIKEETGNEMTLQFEVDESLEVKQESKPLGVPSAHENSINFNVQDGQSDFNKRLCRNLNPKYTFDSFIVGTNNKFAYSISKAIADNPGAAHNPLFIYGGVGLGKTHLMHAIGHQMLNKYGSPNIRYATTEAFTNELIESLRRKNTSDFRSRFREIDLILLDDVQFLEGKERTQEEFFNTFNTLYESGKQIVLSADRPPKMIKGLADRLISRFEWGIMVDIQPPDIETRIAILKNKAQVDKMDVPSDVIELIASSYQNNIRELEGVLNRVIAFVGITGCSMDVNSVRNLINSTSRTKTLTPESIIQAVADQYEISTADIKGSSRMKKVAQARQIAIYLTRDITQLSFPNIGDEFGKKHSTVIYSYEKIKEELLTNHQLSNLVSSIKARLT